MHPSEVRKHVLHDHDALRRRMDEVERLAEAVVGGRTGPIVGLRDTASALLGALRDHMAWEDRFLVPTLREADAWGPERVALLEADHVRQRADLQQLLESLEDRSQPAAFLASRVLEWIHELHADMVDEESAFLDPAVLRDDVVGIDVETG